MKKNLLKRRKHTLDCHFQHFRLTITQQQFFMGIVRSEIQDPYQLFNWGICILY